MTSETQMPRRTAPWPAHRQALREEVRGFIAGERQSGAIPIYGLPWTHHDRGFSERCAARGYVAMTWPNQFGGHDRTAGERFVICEELIAGGAPVGSHWIADRQSGPQILRNGSDAMKARLLPLIATGKLTVAIGMSEPDAGSDLAAIRSRADPVDGGWSLNGRKIWTTNAHNADYMVVLCRTEPATAKRQAGMSQLVVDMASSGISIRPLITLPGIHDFNEVLFEDVFVPANAMLGQPGDGWRLVTEELAFERSGPDRYLSTFGLLRAIIDAAGPDPDRDHARAIGRIVTRMASVRQLSAGIADLLQAGASPRVEASMMKELGTTLEQDIPELAREILRVRPSRDGCAVAQALATAILHAPSFSLRGGTREILQSIVAKELVG